ncbi:MAG: Clp protease ClpS [Marinilabiliales bacterium]|nr:MAG: Clp protease ClpS [Marinilabiliales bacterium]
MALKQKKSNKKSSQKKDESLFLILHNDDINTFNHVIESLVEICNHDDIQAEQCAYITHYKGKCDVKIGSFNELSLMKDQLHSKGLTTTIE